MPRTIAPANAAGMPAENSADPVLTAVLAYEAEASHINGLPGPDLDGVPMPAWERLEHGPHLPPAKTREGALAALRCAVQYEKELHTPGMVANLTQAALGFFQRATGPEDRIDAALTEIRAALAEKYPDHFVTGHASLRVSTGAVVAGAYPEKGYEARLHFHADDPVHDPALEVIAEWRVVSDRYWSFAGLPDDVMRAAEVMDAAATIRAMNTVPTTLEGLRAFCEMACLMTGRETAGGGGLSDWRPRKGESVEAMFMRTLATAVRNLLPERREP